MHADAIYQQLTTILRDVFDDDALVARADLTADDVEEWDSLSHLRLITTVQKTFGIKFSAAEVGKLGNVGDLARLIQAKAP
jgi:acyl carrier protein